MPPGFNDVISNCEVVKVNKQSSKVWIKFIQWLRHVRVTTVRDFKSASEWKWQYGDQSDMKRDDNEYDEHEQDEINFRQKVCKHSRAKQKLSEQCYGMLVVFKNGYLRIIESDKEFICDEIIEEEGKY